jgi:hypothetical protein
MDFRFREKSDLAADITPMTTQPRPEADIIGAVPPTQFGLD